LLPENSSQGTYLSHFFQAVRFLAILTPTLERWLSWQKVVGTDWNAGKMAKGGWHRLERSLGHANPADRGRCLVSKLAILAKGGWHRSE
jgi:hypothetical protein